jgi:superfamily II DNA or RNA helicase
MPPQLRPYQLDVLERGRRHIARGARRLVIQGATGSGKGHILAEAVRSCWAKGRTALVLVNRRKLVSQLSGRLDLFGVPHGVIMADVDPTQAAVQVASRDTLMSRSLKLGCRRLPPADLVALDECHNLDPWWSGEEDDTNVYQQLLRHYQGSIILGFSATPARSDGHGLGNFWHALECTVPTSQLVREGWLCPVACYAPESAVKGKTHKGLAADPVAMWKRHGEGRPTVLFAAKVEQSRAAMVAFNMAGISAEHIDAKTPDDKREEVLARVRCGLTRVLCNVGIAIEGLDLPELSCCILLRACGNQVLWLQIAGRVMRPAPGKDSAVILDHSGACIRHGFPDADVEWSLDEGDTVQRRSKQARQDDRCPKPIRCSRCFRLFARTEVCPGCGKALWRRQKAAPVRDEILIAVGHDGSLSAAALAQRLAYWRECLYTMAATGRTAAAAGQMFRKRFGDYPRDLPDIPQPGSWNLPVTRLFPNYAPRRKA